MDGDEANYLPTLPEDRSIALGLKPAPFLTLCRICSYYMFNELVKDGAPLDVKDRIQEELGQTVQLGGHWFEWSTTGNILFGYYGTAWGITGPELHTGAAVAQFQDYLDDPKKTQLGPLVDTTDDYYAIEFGIKLYKAGYAPDGNVTVNEFTALLTNYEHLNQMALSNPPPGTVVNPDWPYRPGYFYNSGKPQPAFLFPSFQE